MRRFYYTEEGEDDDGGQDDDGDGDEGKAYSLSETASLSFRCSSRPSANPLLLSVASTHLNKRKWNKISVTRKINHPISRFFSTQVLLPFPFFNALSKPLHSLQLFIEILMIVVC